jgi:2-methylcitrate dehydratase PrpD
VPGATDQLVEWVVSAADDDVPAETRAFTRGLLLKTVTTLVLGSLDPFGQIVLRHAAAQGGTPQAGIAGSGLRTSLENAAFANGTIAHTPEMEDCFFRPENRETSSPVWMFPALLNAAEAFGSTGRELVTAAVVSFEVASRLVRGAPGLGVVHGINTCTWWGVPATAAGVARLLHLDAQATANAMSIALSQSCGLGYQTGFDAHKLEAGHSCRAGTTAALLARDGATGAPNFLEDLNLAFVVVAPDGTADPAATVAGLGEAPFTVHEVEFKKYPGCGLLHASVDALSGLMADEGLDSDDVASVRTWVSRHTAAYCDRPHPATLDSARWSFGFALAEVLDRGRITLETFSDPSRLTSERHRELRDRIQVAVDPDLSTGYSGAHVEVDCVDGRHLERTIESFLGHPDQPVSPSQIVEILRPFLADAMPGSRADRLVDLVMGLDHLETVGELMDLITDFRSLEEHA